MNNHEREDRRKLQERRERQREEFACCSITRPHRACERECLDLKDRIKALESLLARSGCMIVSLKESIKDEFKYVLPSADSVIAEIDAILPATEVNK